MASFAFVLIMAAVLVGAGRSLVRSLDTGRHLSRAETAAFAFPIGALFLYFGVLLIGPFRLDGATMWGLFGVMAAAAAFNLRGVRFGQFLNTVKNLPTIARHNPWATCLWTAIVLTGGSALVQGMAPPNDYDGLMYHLAFPRFDVERGFVSVPWDRKLPHALFPQLGGNISRFSLATMNDGVAQMMHGLFGLLGAAAAGLVMRRLGYGRDLALITALLFLVSRVVIWEMGTSETDVPLAALAALAMLAYLVFRTTNQTGIMVIFGLMIGAGILFKLIGFVIALAFAPMIIADLLDRNRSKVALMAGPLAALALITPHLTLTFMTTGNPFYPLFASVLNPGALESFSGINDMFGTGRGIVDFLISPWTIFTLPMHYYDGMVFGTPYLLALAPLVFLTRGSLRVWRGVLGFMFVYFVFWFWGFGQQTRFLLPLVPFLAGMSAAGLGALWDLSANSSIRRAGVFLVVVAFGLNQVLFVGIYTLLRVPPAVGLMNDAAYHARTPTMNGAYFETCTYIADNLKLGERYLSVTGAFHSYYCPQSPVVYNFFADEARWWMERKTPPGMDGAEFIKRFEQSDFRYVIVSWANETRRGLKQVKQHEARENLAARSETTELGGTNSRFSEYLDPALEGLTPLVRGPMTAVYDGPQVLGALRRNLR